MKPSERLQDLDNLIGTMQAAIRRGDPAWLRDLLPHWRGMLEFMASPAFAKALTKQADSVLRAPIT